MAKQGSVLGAIIGGGLAAGACDFIYASVFYYVWKQITPMQIWQSVASGLIGPEAAKAGGYKTMALGIGLHFFIATMMATAFVLVSQRLRFLARAPFVFGPLYGLFLYYFMNLVVVQLSRVAVKPDISHLPTVGTYPINFYGGLMIHMVVGTVIALFARGALKEHRL